MSRIKETIYSTFRDICIEQDVELSSEVSDDLVLLGTDLDSLGFAILVAELETRLGYDPFVLMETPVYPRTMHEFVTIYESFSDHANLDVRE